MLGRIIYFIIIMIYICWLNLKDFVNLQKGVQGYIQCQSGLLYTTLALMTIPMLVFDLKGTIMITVTIILEVIYVAFYTWIYFKIKEERKK